MIRSRAIRSLPALLLACVATALPWRSVRAQSGLSHLDDATMVPQGEFRLQTIAAWTRFNAPFAPAGTAGPTISLGSEFRFDSLGVRQLPTLTGTQNAIQTLTGSPFRLSLGAMQSAIDARVVVMPISLEYGLFHRLTVGAMLPMVRTRMSIMLRVNPLGTEGNVGVNPASVNPGSLAADSAVVTQLAQAAAALQSTLQGCQANPGSDPSCTQILARQADVTALLQNSVQFAAAFSAVYGANAQDRGSPAVPVSGSPADNLIRTRIAAYDSSFQAFLSTAPRVTAMPAAAGGVVGTADLANLLHNPAIAGFDSLSSTVRIGPGDLELSARYLLLDEFADSTIGANPTGLHSRATVTGILRLPTGQLATASNPLDIATGRGTTAAGARLAFYSQWGTRGGLSMSGSYMQSFGKTKIGNALSDQEDWPAALAAYRDALSIARVLAASDPNNTDWQRDLSVSLEKVAGVLATQGDQKGTLKAYMDSFVIADRLAKLDPGNADWQRDLSITLSEIGMLKVKQRDIKGARQAFQDSLDIRQQLAQSDPDNATWQRDLVVAMIDYAQVAKNPRAVLSQALDMTQELDRSGRLAPRYKFMIKFLRDRLAKAK